MKSEEKIKEWWERNIKNYIKNYAQWNKLSLAQAHAKFFIETHEKFLEHSTRTSKIIAKLFISQAHHRQLMHTLRNDGRTNLSE